MRPMPCISTTVTSTRQSAGCQWKCNPATTVIVLLFPGATQIQLSRCSTTLCFSAEPMRRGSIPPSTRRFRSSLTLQSGSGVVPDFWCVSVCERTTLTNPFHRWLLLVPSARTGGPYLARFSRDVGFHCSYPLTADSSDALYGRHRRNPYLAKNERDMGHPSLVREQEALVRSLFFVRRVHRLAVRSHMLWFPAKRPSRMSL